MADSNLLSKLKYRPGYNMVVLNAPADYLPKLQDVHHITEITDDMKEVDLLHIFVYQKTDVDRLVPKALKYLKYDGLLWMSYPKGTSGIISDVNRDKGWDTLHTSGLHGIALIAIDDTWAAMRFRPIEKIKSLKKE